jgi:hypothetical protein
MELSGTRIDLSAGAQIRDTAYVVADRRAPRHPW